MAFPQWIQSDFADAVFAMLSYTTKCFEVRFSDGKGGWLRYSVERW